LLIKLIFLLHQANHLTIWEIKPFHPHSQKGTSFTNIVKNGLENEVHSFKFIGGIGQKG